MKHKCGTVVDGNTQIRVSTKLYIEFKGIINERKEIDRTGNAQLVSENSDAFEHLFYCKSCKDYFPISEIIFEDHCICGTELENGQKCIKLDRNICPNCYKTFMPRICLSCQFIIGCRVYQRNNK
jgi:hypothetical protein